MIEAGRQREVGRSVGILSVGGDFTEGKRKGGRDKGRERRWWRKKGKEVKHRHMERGMDRRRKR